MKQSNSGSSKRTFAFVVQNVRKLAFEDQVALGAHAGTLVACFLPWASLESIYGPIQYMNAFSGASWLIGTVVFGLSFAAVILFMDELFEKKIFRCAIPRTTLLGAASIQSLLLQVCAWSVFSAIGGAGIDFRFGIVACVLLQIVALVAVWLRARSSKKEEVKDFFQLPNNEKPGELAVNHTIK